ncbi:MAG TPA: T9SS type A sorting domain-containing protein [Candidatus Eisenbacteria bacterium]
MRNPAAPLVAPLLIAACAGIAAPSIAATASPPKGPAAPNAVSNMDISHPMDVNALHMDLTNFGAFAYDLAGGTNFGLRFPKDSPNGVVFASGLWLGALVQSGARVTVAEYSQEYRPGSALSGVPESPGLVQLQTWELQRTYTSTIDRDAARDDYDNNAVSRGAPAVAILPDGSLDISGDRMSWSVYNDFTPSAHVDEAGSTAPLGVEVQQTTWAYDRPGPFGNSVFMRFKIINRGSQVLDDMHVAFWADPDLGNFSDDLVGCDSTRSLGYCYNGANTDALYGSTPPAVGYDMLQGPYSAARGARLPMTAFMGYRNGDDPLSATGSFRNMHGLDRLGNVVLDPQSQPTRFMFAGDPVAGTGWVDGLATDKRMLLSAGPITMSPNDVQEVVLAIIVARGSDRLDSVHLLADYDQTIQTAFDTNTLGLLDVGDRTGARLALAPVYPNPARGELSVALSLPASGPATLELLDLAGRRVAVRAIPAAGPGPRTESFAREARSLPAGMYFVRLSQSGASVVRRVVLLP